MKNVLQRTVAIYPELEKNGYVAKGAIQEKFWSVTSAQELQGSYPSPQAVFDALLSFANLASGRRGDVDPGWIGKTKSVLARAAHFGRVIAVGADAGSSCGRRTAIHVDVGMADICRDQAARRS